MAETIFREIPVQGPWGTASWARRQLPATPPVAPNSAAIMANFLADYRTGNTDGYFEPSLQLPGQGKQYSHTLIEVDNSMPLMPVTEAWQPRESAQGVGEKHPFRSAGWFVSDDLARVPNPTTIDGATVGQFRVPPNLPIPDGTDHGVGLYNVDTRQYLELWIAEVKNNHLVAAWGGYKEDVTGWNMRWDDPQYVNGVPNPRYHSGCGAVGLPLLSYVVRLDEWLSGEIHHPVGIGIINALNQVCYPGVRTDGTRTGDYLAEGQMLFLPSDYPEAGKNWHHTTKALVKAAKRYGLINTDRTNSGIGMNAVNPAQFQEYILGGESPYWQLGISEDYNEWLYRIWNGTAKNAAGVNWDPFPFEALQVMQKDYSVPDSASVTDPVLAIATEVLPSVRRRTNQSIDYLRGRAAKTAKDVEANTKTLIGDGPITVTETPEGIKIGSTATSGGSVELDTTTTLEDVM